MTSLYSPVLSCWDRESSTRAAIVAPSWWCGWCVDERTKWERERNINIKVKTGNQKQKGVHSLSYPFQLTAHTEQFTWYKLRSALHLRHYLSCLYNPYNQYTPLLRYSSSLLLVQILENCYTIDHLYTGTKVYSFILRSRLS